MSLFGKRNDNSSKKVETVDNVPTKSTQEVPVIVSPVIVSTKLRVVEKTMLLSTQFGFGVKDYYYSCYILFADYKYNTFEYRNLSNYSQAEADAHKTVEKQVKKVYAIVEKDKTYDVEIQKNGLYVNSTKTLTLDRIVSINGIKI